MVSWSFHHDWFRVNCAVVLREMLIYEDVLAHAESGIRQRVRFVLQQFTYWNYTPLSVPCSFPLMAETVCNTREPFATLKPQKAQKRRSSRELWRFNTWRLSWSASFNEIKKSVTFLHISTPHALSTDLSPRFPRFRCPFYVSPPPINTEPFLVIFLLFQAFQNSHKRWNGEPRPVHLFSQFILICSILRKG